MSRADIAKSIIATLRAAHAPPVYGFVNARGLAQEPDSAEALRVWRAAGFPLGNHAYSHMDLNANAANDWENNVLDNERTLTAYMGRLDWRWLRFPYLREGDTPEKRLAIARFLKAHGYRIAEVTLSGDDWAYNDAYARCVAKGDDTEIAWMRESYLKRTEASIVVGQAMAKQLYGRDIRHILLMHIGGFTAATLPDVVALLTQHGFTLVTLPRAASDPVYAAFRRSPAEWGGEMLQQEMKARHLPVPEFSEDPVPKAAALCR
jgi:peptidoglycan/xylan/chitin deacetylase (PgdA/CDA1 family)